MSKISKETNSIARSKLKIITWNINSRNMSHEGSKFMMPDFKTILNMNDIICLQETKGQVKLENYKAFNSNRPDSKSGE